MPTIARLIGRLALLAPLTLATPALADGVRYIDDGAAAGGDGQSWKSAFDTLRDGLAAAVSDPTITELRLGGGRYLAAVDEGEGADRGGTFRIPSGLTVRGGYAGVDSGDPDLRDPVQFITILDGDLDGDDGPEFANRSDNSFQVVTLLDADETTLIEGLTIRGGQADGPDFGEVPESRDRGAALNIWGGAPTIRNVIIEDHATASHGAINDHGTATLLEASVVRRATAGSHGAGLYCAPLSATSIIGCRFESMASAGNGGGIFNDGSVNVVCRDSVFELNNAVRGSGIYTELGGVTEIEDCTFTGNTATRAGAGLFNQMNKTLVTGCTFTGNTAVEGEGGAGIWNEGGAPTVMDCTFEDNVAFRGAGVYSIDSDAIVINCTFIGNEANAGAGTWNDGGSPYTADCLFVENIAATGAGIYNENGFAVMVNCTFIHNEANVGDGGGGIVNSFDSQPTIIGCNFVENIAINDLFGGGGGVASYVASVAMFDCQFTRNYASRSGGAMYIEANTVGGPTYVSHCTFHGNSAADGGAIHNFRSQATMTNSVFVGNFTTDQGTERGGAIYNHFTSHSHLINSTLVDNASAVGPAVANADFSDPTIVNSILWDSGDGPMIGGDLALARYSIVRGGYPGDEIGSDDPGFVQNPDPGADGVYGTTDDNYGDLRLTAGSPAIDAGHAWSAGFDRGDLDKDGDVRELVAVDIDHQPRFAIGSDDPTGCGVRAIIDLGAYEFAGATPSVRFGDLDGDGAVALSDLIAVLNAWGPCQDACCLADVDVDGEVDFRDLLEVLGMWN